MDNFEEQLKNLAKEKKEVNIADSIMKKIEDKDVKMRSAWFFHSKKFTLTFSFVLIFIAMVFIVNLALYDIRESNSLEYTTFGVQGYSLILKSLPYVLVISFLALFVIAVWMMSRFEISYKKPFALFVVILVAGASMGGTAIFASDFNDQVQEKVDNEELKVPIFKPVAKMIYKKHGPSMMKNNGLIGKVVVPPLNSNEFIISIPQGKQINVKLMHNYKIFPEDKRLATGDLIVIMGRPIVDFHAEGIKVIEDQKKAMEMLAKLKDRNFQMKFRQRAPLKDFTDFPNNPEIQKDFLENMGGVLQSGQDIKQANIMFGH